MPESIPQYDSWADVIWALEHDAKIAGEPQSAMDAPAHAAWTPPTHLGPLPLHLRERAESVLEQQRESIRNVEELHRETGRHLAAVRAVPREADGRSVYLDVSG